MAQMTDEDLLRILRQQASDANQVQDEELSKARAQAMRDYLRKPYGNEEDGRSNAITSDVFDSVEGMLPDLVEVFISSDKAVVFDPVGADDVESAEQVTNACNYVFYKQNNGFLLLYTAAKDGLMLRCGGVKWFWEKKRTPDFVTFHGWNDLQIAEYLVTNPDTEIVGKDIVVENEGPLLESAKETLREAGIEQPELYTVKFKTIKERGVVRLINLPPDRLLVHKDHNSILLDDCPYVAHFEEKSVSDIIQMGYTIDEEDVRHATSASIGASVEREDKQEEQPLDPAMIKGWLVEEYVLVDYDGDGVAERRRIVRLGDLILDNEECSHVPIAAWTPYVLTHRFSGLSVADLVSDFQRINTDILRQSMDNLYLANNQETVVLSDRNGATHANIDDLLNRRPGGILREYAAGAIRPYMQQWTGIQAQPMIEMLNVAKENRTGFTRYSQGLDGNSLNKTATGVSMIMNASQKRMKLMARIMAEALVVPVFRGIFKTLTDYCMERLSFRLNGKFVQYDPQEWRDQYDMTVNVGIGQADSQAQMAMLQQIAQAQAVIAGSPYASKLLDPTRIYNLQARIAEEAGFKNPGEFWLDPATVPDEEPQIPPQVQLEQEKMQQQQQQHTDKLQADVQKTQAQMQLELEKHRMTLEFQAEQNELERQNRLRIEEMRPYKEVVINE